MKKILKITFYLSFVLAIGLFNGCEETDDYDYNSITPKVLGLNGPEAVAAHGLAEFPYTFSASYHRGGSTLEWSATTASGVGEVAITTEDVATFKGKIAKVVFPQRSTADVATITVTETTMGGVTSAPYTYEVTLDPFCPYPMADFVGNYTGTSTSHAETVTTELTANLNELRVYELANFVQASWGENWVEGDGSCVMEFSCGDVVTIAKQFIGDSDYPDTYLIEGSGTVDVDAKTITLVYEVFYTGGSVPGIETTLTLDGKSAGQIVSFNVPKK